MSESFNILPANIVKRDDISLAAKGLYWLLKSYQNNKTKVAFPSLSTLETQSGQSRPTIIKTLKELKIAGIIQYNEGKNKGKNTIYSFNETSESSKKSLPLEKKSSKNSLPKVVKNLYPNYNILTNIYNEIKIKHENNNDLEVWEALILHIILNCPRVSELKNQLTIDQAKKLVDNYDRDIIKEKLNAMENYNKINNYDSVYKTLNDWINRNNQSQRNITKTKQLPQLSSL